MTPDGIQIPNHRLSHPSLSPIGKNVGKDDDDVIVQLKLFPKRTDEINSEIHFEFVREKSSTKD